MQLFDKLERFRNHLLIVSVQEINQNFDDALQWFQDKCIKYNIEGLNKLQNDHKITFSDGSANVEQNVILQETNVTLGEYTIQDVKMNELSKGIITKNKDIIADYNQTQNSDKTLNKMQIDELYEINMDPFQFSAISDSTIIDMIDDISKD
jgi:hypothetical protein